jgi:peptide/nickel transport system ATP-binding protein
MLPDSKDVLVRVRNLSVTYATPQGVVHALRGVNFDLGKEKLGIVGESGSGKSTVGRALLRLIEPPGIMRADEMTFLGQSLMEKTEAQMRRIRGQKITMILQDPTFSLNPVMKIGDQITETLLVHGEKGRQRAAQKAVEILSAVRIRDPERVYRAYPHQLSGGMGQRVMIAMMLVCNPVLLIADEPTSALDVTVQMQVLAIIDDLVTRRGMGLIFISHDLALVGSFCDRILIMYGGRVMETVHGDELENCTHPYSRGLLESLPSLEYPRETLPTLIRDQSWLEET